MPQETFTFDRDSFLSYLIPEAIGHLPKADQEAFFAVWEKTGTEHTCTLIIDGVSLPVAPTLEWIKSGMERLVNEKAQELIAERFASLTSTLYDIEQDAKTRIAEALKSVPRLDFCRSHGMIE
jgi:hypothetical protein